MTKISQDAVLKQMVKHCRAKKIHMLSPRKNKRIVPRTIEDIPTTIRKSSSKMYKSCYSALHYQQNKKSKVRTGARTIMVEAIKERKTTTTKELVVNLSDTITATINHNGLITVDFK